MRRQKLPPITYSATESSTARVQYVSGKGAMHGIEFTFITDQGQKVIVTCPHEVAKNVLNEGIAAYQAIMAPLQIARQTPFGG